MWVGKISLINPLSVSETYYNKASKMTIEVVVVAKETIRPSSQTPPHLKTFSLSGLDQYSSSGYIPYLLVYSSTTGDRHRRIHRLKRSLSETLVHIYPLAGRIRDNKHIICDDQGVHFFEANVSGDMFSQFVANPQPEELGKLYPRDDQLLALEEKALLLVQVNFFENGGMALGVLASHKFVDGFGLCLFFDIWAKIARNEVDIQPPKLGAASTFPPSDNIPTILLPSSEEKIVTKRFVFNTANIVALKANFTKRTSRSAAVIALIWRCAMHAEKAKKTVSVATFSVNLRQKQLPLLSENCLGNCIVCTTTSPTPPTAERQEELGILVDKLNEALRIVECLYVKQLKAGDIMFMEPFREVNERCSKGEVERYAFSSVCNFPFYETDFGWGKPVWATSTVAFGHKNVILLSDTKCGTGVEAWVTLNQEHMARFEHQPDLLAFTSPNANAALKSNL